MVPEEVLKSLSIKNDARIVQIVIDGLGGLPVNGRTEMEAADLPNLDQFAANSVCGQTDPISRGITPGSGPAHLGLFGYDPLKYVIGRGVLEVLGLGMEMTGSDVAVRGNFATLANGKITDRRAGRIASEKSNKLCEILQKEIPEIDGAKVIIQPGKEHRFCMIFRKDGLDGRVADADPQKTGLKPLPAKPLAPEAQETADIANKFIEKATEALADCSPANTILMRGFANYPDIPSMEELFNLNPAAIAVYPMYKGLAKLVGMKLLDAGETMEDQIECLHKNFNKHDFFYIHYKYADSRGEDGDFDAKVQALEDFDRHMPAILAMEPDVIVVTGDHSTPALLRGHSWHPNPIALWSPYITPDRVKHFTEYECSTGGLGRFESVNIMPMLMAHALKLDKFGA